MPRVPLNMPKMSMTMEEGTIVEWAVEVGGAVKDGDLVVVVTTDKVDMDVESTCNGVLVETLAAEGDVVPVGQPIAWIESETDDLLGDLFAPAPSEDAPVAPGDTAEVEKSAETRGEVTAEGARPDAALTEAAADAAPADLSVDATRSDVSVDASPAQAPRAVPLARRLAEEAGIDLAAIEPGGPWHTIRARDVRAAIEEVGRAAASETPAPVAASEPPAALAARPAPTPAAAPASEASGDLLGDAKQRRIRRATAGVMNRSTEVPQFTAYRPLVLTRMAKARLGALKGVSWNTILLRAYAMTLRSYPALNGYWTDAGVVGNEEVGVSMAIDTPSGLLAPVVRGADRMTIKELDRTVRAMASDAKEGRVDPDRFRGGTGTLSNLGGMGVRRFNALLTPPQATALSLGSVERVPSFDEDGDVVASLVCEVGLTLDHRVADGADAARALSTMQELLDDPLLLLA